MANPGRWRELVARPWFDPVATLLAIALLLGGLFAYTDNWPPLVVVESSSMQHGLHDVLGVINTGDLVLVKRVDAPSGVTTYLQGETAPGGYSTYGEFGDVLLYFAYGETERVPVIHRAILWLDWNGSARLFAAPSLAPLPCGPSTHANYEILPPGSGGGSSYGCVSPSDPNSPVSGKVELFHVGWRSVSVEIDLGNLAQYSPYSGFITMGDDNCVGSSPCASGGQGEPDQSYCDQVSCAVSFLVRPSWVEGVARGMTPWFGALKLWLAGNGEYVPPETGEYLGLTILAVIVLPTVVPRFVHRWRRRSQPPGEENENDRPTSEGEGEDTGETSEETTAPAAEPVPPRRREVLPHEPLGRPCGWRGASLTQVSLSDTTAPAA